MKKKIRGIFNLIRFELPFSAGVCVVLGQVLSSGEFASLRITLLGFTSVFFISASILAFNDYFDIESDKVNAPFRPIPSNLILPSEALLFAVLLLLIGLVLSYKISFVVLIIAIGLALIGFLYNRYFKRSGLLGNLMVSFSVGMTFLYGGATVELLFNKVIIFFGIIAALVDLGEEIAADSMDMEGDKLINSNSIAIKRGKAEAIKISSFIFILVILLTFVPFLLKWFSPIYIIPIGIMDLVIGYSTYGLIKSKNNEGRKYIRILYLGATVGLILFLVIRLFET